MGIVCDRRAVTDWILRYIKTTFFTSKDQGYVYYDLKVVLAWWKVKTPCHANGVFLNKCYG